MDPNAAAERQAIVDAEQLRLLTIFFYVFAGIAALATFLAGLWMTFLGALFRGAHEAHGPPPAFLAPVLLGMGLFALVAGAAFAVALFFTARFLGERTHRTFCLVVSGLCCVQIPFGAALGVFSLIVLTRASVRALFSD